MNKKRIKILQFFSKVKNLNDFQVENNFSNFYKAYSDYCVFDIDLFSQLYDDYIEPESKFSVLLYYYDSIQDEYIYHHELEISSKYDVKLINEYLSDYTKLPSNTIISRVIIIKSCNSFFAVSDEFSNQTIFLFNDKFIEELLNNDFIEEGNFFCYF